MMEDPTGRFRYSSYLVRKKILKLLGGAFHIYDPSGNVVLYSQMKAFKLREDIRLYTGEDMATEVISIKARQIFDFGATYDVTDSMTGQRIGALRRKGLKSILKDEWLILDTADQEVGIIAEDSVLLALVRRFIPLGNLIPQTYQTTMGTAQVCTFKQNMNPLVTKVNVDFSPDVQGMFDKRIGLAAGLLLCAIEGKQAAE